ncbi:MAG: DUF998 domain-containing protein [Candidatus Krumholzibacteriia bacterium]
MDKPAHGEGKTRLLLLCGALAGPLFCIAWFSEGLARDGYDPLRHAISGLSLGENGWTQIANFIVTGISTVALAFGLSRAFRSGRTRTWTTILITTVGIGFLGTGLFASDPMNGYPPGTPALVLPPTLSGAFHVFFSSLIFGLPVACLVVARNFDDRGEGSWAIYARSTAGVFIIVYLSAMAGFLQQQGLVDYAGLLQRISLVIVLTWMTLLSFHLLDSTPHHGVVGPSAARGGILPPDPARCAAEVKPDR